MSLERAPKLKPCPACGATLVKYKAYASSEGRWVATVNCRGCEMELKVKNGRTEQIARAMVVSTWNDWSDC